jgi:hypothetical protein
MAVIMCHSRDFAFLHNTRSRRQTITRGLDDYSRTCAYDKTRRRRESTLVKWLAIGLDVWFGCGSGLW